MARRTHPAATPCAKSTKSRLSRTGSRRLTIKLRPRPVSSKMTVPEHDQQRRKREAGQERHEAQLAQQTLVVERAGDGQEDASGGYALREIHEEQAIAQRVAQADHQDEAQDGEK